MNIEKEVTITDLKAKFTKDLDSLSKMDPFLEFSVGKNMRKTETAHEAGKQAAWRDSIVLTYFDETHILVKAYDQDNTENEFIGLGKLQIKSLRFPGGIIDLAVATDSGQNIGNITGKYTVKNLNQSPLLLLKNLKVELLKESKLFLKAKPYLQATVEEISMATDPKDEIVGTTMTWNENLRLKIKDNSKITISLIDKTEDVEIFCYQCSAKQFRLQSGSKKFNVLDRSYNQLGHLLFDFETANLVSKEESVKNIDKEKKSDNELSAITVEQIQVELPKEDIDVYYKIIVGTNHHTTEVIRQNPKSSSVQVKKVFYAEAKENKLIVVAMEKGMITDDIIGHGELLLDSLSSGEKKIPLLNATGKEEIGSVTLTIVTKQTANKSLILDSISINISEEGDIIGTPEPFVVARVGCCSGRTETSNEVKATFKKDIELRFGEEENIEFEIWDEDVGTSNILYSETISLSELKPPKGEYTVNLTRRFGENQSEGKGKLTFKYQMKGIAPESPVRKVTQKKAETNRSHKEVSQKEEPKKEVKKEITTAREKSQADLESSRPKQQQINNESVPISHRAQEQRHHSLNKDSISRSKETLNLPSIMSSFHQVYGDRIFDKQSAATLQKTIVAYSMPKANRFVNEPKYSGEPSYCLDTCFKSSTSKGAGFGFGKKKQFPDWMEKNMKENPAPGSYFDSHYDPRSRGPTFGLGHKYYERVMIPREQKPQPHTAGRKLSPIRDPTPK